MNTTKILGQAVGIQSKGVVDKTEIQTRERLTSAMIVGRFMRGRTDKPMTIHQGNIRGQLGYEPNNLDYIAVQDCLDTGLPSIQVLRIGIQGAGGSQISCTGATSILNLLTSQPADSLEYEYWRFEVSDATTGQVYSIVNNLNRLETENLGQSLERLKSGNCPLSFSESPSPDFFTVIQNTSDQDLRLKVVFKKLISDGEPDVIDLSIMGGSTPTYSWEKQVGGEDYEFVVCLSPYTPVLISCEGANAGINFENISGTWDFYIDDFDDPILTGTAGSFVSLIATDYPYIQSDYDGFFFVLNIDNQPHRFKMEPVSGASYLNATRNPTFIEHEDGSLTFCLAPFPDRLFEYAEIDIENSKIKFSFSGSNIGTIDITDPSGTVTQYTPIANQILVLDYVEGFYTFHSDGGFKGFNSDGSTYNIGDIHYRASTYDGVMYEPVINSVTRGANNIVTITGTATTSTVVGLISDISNDDPIAYEKVLDGETDFTFVLELPPNFSGYIRCLLGNQGSPGATFTI
ncbi:hypothetical protein F959_01691 [Acinetobacter venetianus RAG-1 = CIP 110063]|uniref:Uncharacterized protein n=1 Tax=Acinetobacter venetianus (strain ATCC 31012 / DSM 23050 / BCRC 14357 / CCUG 45561 / CIP 110063 / KCTC 2702 / LMG 19082 / RAG-1) TaxID=1191460 RepID=N8ZSY1_ACIVR|nr:hypothetical protein F959_01691 [Acinetobacter venetianus RAG-1 = CIP 110063]